MVERAGAWLSRRQAIFVQYQRTSSNYLGLIQHAVSLRRNRRAVRLALMAAPNIAYKWFPSMGT
jgi:hypothetical protein